MNTITIDIIDIMQHFDWLSSPTVEAPYSSDTCPTPIMMFSVGSEACSFQTLYD